MNTTLTFGTDGIRGDAQSFPFTTAALYKLGCAIAQWSKQFYHKVAPTFLVGCDTRMSCDRIKNDLLAGLHDNGLTGTDGGVLPTPAILRLLKMKDSSDFGIIISASHNPYTDNGIKLFDGQHGKLSQACEDFICEAFKQQHSQGAPPLEPAHEPTHAQDRCNMHYHQLIEAQFPPQFLHGKTIVLDCAHGATYDIAPRIFSAFGAQVISLNAAPTGTNINDQCGSLHPEQLQLAVQKHQAYAGFAFDGDGDRVIAVAPDGSIKDGDDILSLLIEHPLYQNTPQVVGTAMTNLGFEEYLKGRGKQLLRTQVGDKYVALALDQHKLTLGGEASGHIILSDYLSSGDGIFVALRILETLIAHASWKKVLFPKYHQTLINIPVRCKRPLEEEPCSSLIQQHAAELPTGRVVVRYSGTENKLRILTEDKDAPQAIRVAEQLASALQHALEGAQ